MTCCKQENSINLLYTPLQGSFDIAKRRKLRGDEVCKKKKLIFNLYFTAFPESQLGPISRKCFPWLKEELQLFYLMDCNKINCLLLARRIISSVLWCILLKNIQHQNFQMLYVGKLWTKQLKWVSHNHQRTDSFLSLKNQDINVSSLKPSFPTYTTLRISTFSLLLSIKAILHLFRWRVACRTFLSSEEHEPLTGVIIHNQYERGLNTWIMYSWIFFSSTNFAVELQLFYIFLD